MKEKRSFPTILKVNIIWFIGAYCLFCLLDHNYSSHVINYWRNAIEALVYFIVITIIDTYRYDTKE